MQLAQFEFDRGGIAFKVVQAEALEIADQHVARQFGIADACEVIGGLCVGCIQIHARALVLGQHHAGPEHVDAAMRAAGKARGFLLEHGHAATLDTEHIEEPVPEALRFGALAGFPGPFLGECACALADFVETQWHPLPSLRRAYRKAKRGPT
nr:hypothetical protein [Thermomonas sp. HDW16]